MIMQKKQPAAFRPQTVFFFSVQLINDGTDEFR